MPKAAVFCAAVGWFICVIFQCGSVRFSVVRRCVGRSRCVGPSIRMHRTEQIALFIFKELKAGSISSPWNRSVCGPGVGRSGHGRSIGCRSGVGRSGRSVDRSGVGPVCAFRRSRSGPSFSTRQFLPGRAFVGRQGFPRYFYSADFAVSSFTRQILPTRRGGGGGDHVSEHVGGRAHDREQTHRPKTRAKDFPDRTTRVFDPRLFASVMLL